MLCFNWNVINMGDAGSDPNQTNQNRLDDAVLSLLSAVNSQLIHLKEQPVKDRN